MGDEMHQRNVGCSSLMVRAVAPDLARSVEDHSMLADMLAFLGANDQFFLNIAMAMGKAVMDPVRGIDAATVVTAMSRNGTDFGITVSGLDDQWFTAPVEMPTGLYFPGFTAADANPDMGDSTIVETVGLGGFAMAAAPAVAGFVGAGSAAEAANTTRTMGEITLAQNPEWTMPSLDYQGVPTGIDIRLVVETGITPLINTGIAHREPGVGQVGAGVVRAPGTARIIFGLCGSNASVAYRRGATRSRGRGIDDGHPSQSGDPREFRPARTRWRKHWGRRSDRCYTGGGRNRGSGGHGRGHVASRSTDSGAGGQRSSTTANIALRVTGRSQRQSGAHLGAR